MADVSITAANVALATESVSIDTVVLGATMTPGDVAYLDSADSDKAKPAQADDADTDAAVGVLLTGGDDGDQAVMIRAGKYKAGGTLVAGGVYVVSAASAGGIAPIADRSSPDYLTILGYAVDTETLQLDIEATGVNS